MILSRAKRGGAGTSSQGSAPGSATRANNDSLDPHAQQISSNPKFIVQSKLLELLRARDYTGALTLLELERSFPDVNRTLNWLWTAFAAFHLGDYQRCHDIFENLCREYPTNGSFFLSLAVCQFYLGLYKEADLNANKAKPCKLQSRLLFHLAHKLGDEKRLMFFHQNLQDVVEDQLALSSMHYLRAHFQESIDIYKRLLIEHPSFQALNVYLALCYYRLDFFDVAQDVLATYPSEKLGTSLMASNLRACIQYKLFGGRIAEQELHSTLNECTKVAHYGREIIEHNLGVFKCSNIFSSNSGRPKSSFTGGSSGTQSSSSSGAVSSAMLAAASSTFERLLDVIPEARLNLALFKLRIATASLNPNILETDSEVDGSNIAASYDLMKHVEPSSPSEYILKATTNAAVGQSQESREHLKMAQQYFQLVGSSSAECDTISGRQCMASCFFLLRNFEDSAVYLNSIKTYFFQDDPFNMNLAQVKAALLQFPEAEEAICAVQNPKIRASFTFRSLLARCYIMNRKAKLAWDVYIAGTTQPANPLQPNSKTSGAILAAHSQWTKNEAYLMLQLIASDCYQTEQYYISAKAYDALERLEPSPEHWEGKRGACIGLFQKVYLGQIPREQLRDIVVLLDNTEHPQVDYLVRVMRNWC